MTVHRSLASVFALCACLAVGCGAVGGDLGATPGGALDFSYVREAVARGQVPRPDDIRTEGLLSEHDLPVEGAPCDSVLCVRPGLAVAPSIETDGDEAWIHVGFSSAADVAERPPLDLVVLVDESASMSSDIHETWESVLNIASHLNGGDQLAILGFNGRVRTIRPPSMVTSLDEVARQVSDIRARGTWDLDPAIETAFRLARESRREGSLSRVILYTCGYPAPSGVFERETRAGADDGIETTVVGVLLGYPAGLADYLGGLRGGSLFYTSSLDDIRSFFREDFDFLMVPLAYDFHMSVQSGAGFDVQRAYGLPDDPTGAPGGTLEVETLFASRRRGAIALRLARPEGPIAAGTPVASVQVSYEPATPGAALVDDSAEVVYPELASEDARHYDGPGTRKLVALVNMAEGMREACERYHASASVEALAILDRLIESLAADAAALGDGSLDPEVDLVRQLRANMAD